MIIHYIYGLLIEMESKNPVIGQLGFTCLVCIVESICPENFE